ncbi:MAG TPA: TetR/AcrR family transcriptional regulator [Solirubrobacteraceae bacterium]|nr:TetR/AcrR family transcriptional regulator [Solirubrobacteraceae bacterium]
MSAQRTTALSRELIAETALAMADRDGVESVSMRRLAAELGVTAMAIYRHFRDKDELIDAIVETAVAEAPMEIAEGTWRERLAATMHDVRENLRRHPCGVELRKLRPVLAPGALRPAEHALTAMLEAGFTREEAARAYRTLFTYTFGFAAFASPPDLEAARRFMRSSLAALPEDEFPALSGSLAEGAAAVGGDEQFAFGLDLLLDGLERRLEDRR